MAQLDDQIKSIADFESAINSMEQDLIAANNRNGALQVQMNAVYRLLIEPPEDNPNGPSRIRRIMDVVEKIEDNGWFERTTDVVASMERGQWAVKWVTRAIITIGAVSSALVAIWGKGWFR